MEHVMMRCEAYRSERECLWEVLRTEWDRGRLGRARRKGEDGNAAETRYGQGGNGQVRT